MTNTFFKIKNYQKTSNLKTKTNKIEKINLTDLNDKSLYEYAITNKDDIIKLLSAISEASNRILGIKPYREQLMAAIAISEYSYLIEMKTGEGKTLTAGISALIRAIRGHKVFVITVNDYLSSRDLDYNKELFSFFNISSSNIKSGDDFLNRKESYMSSIIYGVSSEFVFDFLRDNTVTDPSMRMFDNRVFDTVIIDEIDSILIDESSMPLIISEKNNNQDNSIIIKSNEIVKTLSGKDISDKESESDYIIDNKTRTVLLSDIGIDKVESAFNIDNLYDIKNAVYLHRIEQALVANYMYEIEKDYIIQDSKIILIDQSTGRLSNGRQLSFGLHQAIEAKENIEISVENITSAKITYQEFFNTFNYLSGMTGTAKTEEEEFLEIYSLEIVVIPTHKKLIREDMKDSIFLGEKGKVNKLLEIVNEVSKTGQPLLIGTTSVEENEKLSEILKSKNIKFNQLNAKNAAQEADIIAKAGEVGNITLATNMAGRGVDIKTTEESRNLGGLFVVGFGRYRNRRIDNQLRGRSGRQGEPGKSVFLISLNDEIIKNFGGDRIKSLSKQLDIGEFEIIESKLIEKAIRKAQKLFEDQFFESRKNLVEYNETLSIQMKRVYAIRNEILDIKDVSVMYLKIKDLVGNKASKINYQNDFTELKEHFIRKFNLTISEDNYPESEKELYDYLNYKISNTFLDINENAVLEILKSIYIGNIDRLWKDHLRALESLKEGIDLLRIGQKDPLIEYKKKGFEMFNKLLLDITDSILYNILTLSIEIQNKDIIEEDI